MDIHLIGICGSAMGNLALMLRQVGHTVSGTDEGIYPPMSTTLADAGIDVKPFTDFTGAVHDLYVVGNAISRGNSVLEQVLDAGKEYISMSQALARFFLKGKEVIVVAGSHGKSTTTALCAHLLQEAGLDPSYFFGGITQAGGPSFRLGDGKYFVIEGDEYDTAYFDKAAKFFHYKPKYLILTSLEFDHADIYNSIDELKLTFARLVNMVPGNGYIVASNDYPALNEVTTGYNGYQPRTDIEFYGSSEAADKQVAVPGFADNDGDGRIRLSLAGLDPFPPKLIGMHNALNQTAVTLLGRRLGIQNDIIRNALMNFAGVKRRQEIRRTDGFLLIDDFAHHPSAVAQTINAVRLFFPGRPVWAVFEPRSATSHLNTFQKDWPRAFKDADKAFVCELFNKQKFAADRMLDVKRIVDEIEPPAFYATDTGDMYIQVTKQIKTTDTVGSAEAPIVLIMSNGGFGGLVAKLQDFVV